MNALTHRIDEEGVLWITFDSPGEPVNLLTPATLTALDDLLTDTSGRADVRGLLIGSAKPGMFVAGVDVDEISAVTDSHKGAEGNLQPWRGK